MEEATAIISTKKPPLYFIKSLVLKYQAFLKFGAVGLVGAGIHFLILYLLTDVAHLWYLFSAIISVVIAATSNYILNHNITFRDRQITNHILGWFKYQVMSGITDGIYIGLLALFVEVAGMWYILGAAIAVICVYPIKFGVSSILIWGRKLDPRQADYEWLAFYEGNPIQKWWKQSISKTVHEWIPETRSILEVGCGSSPTIGKYGAKALAIDPNMEKIVFMHNKFPETHFLTTTVFGVPGKFQHIICIEVLEHLHDPSRHIERMASILEDGGRIIIATPDYSRFLWYIAEFFTPYKEEHIKKYSRRSLEKTCLQYGLVPLKHRYVATCDLVEMFEKVGNA